MHQFQSNHREDALLNRLKQCVGQIQKKTKFSQQNQNHSNRFTHLQEQSSLSKDIKSKYYKKDQTFQVSQANKLQYYQHRTANNKISDKQNIPDKKYYVRQRDHRVSSSLKRNDQRSIQLNHQKSNDYSKFNATRNSLQQTSLGDYNKYSTNKKPLVPLSQNQSITKIKRDDMFYKQELSQNKSNLYNNFLTTVSQSTRKRIAERQNLISTHDDMKSITPTKRAQQSNSKTFINENNCQQNNFLERLNLRKKQYGQQTKYMSAKIDDNNFYNHNFQSKTNQVFTRRQQTTLPSKNQSNAILKRKTFLQNQQQQDLKSIRNCFKQFDPRQNVKNNIQIRQKTNLNLFTRPTSYKNSQKMQKLNKITQMNEQINNKIRKIVDNFQNYLTHRPYS